MDESEILMSECEDYLQVEQSQENFGSSWSEAVVQAIESVADFDPRPPVSGHFVESPLKQYYNQRTKSWVNIENTPEPLPPEPPESLPAYSAMNWKPGAQGVDLRPHIWDTKSKAWLLVDSGSQVTAYPPEPGDKEVKNLFLRAVNGSRIKCYGRKS